MREQGFTDFLKVEYPQIVIVSRVESFEDPQITYEKTVQLLAEQPDLRGIYITCGGVAQVGRALIETGRANDRSCAVLRELSRDRGADAAGRDRLDARRRQGAAGRAPGQAHHG